MIIIKPCIIELNVDSTQCGVYDNNKIKANEHKGHTSGGTPIHYYTLYKKDKKGTTFFGYYTPFEIIQHYGTYQVIYE
jgi:hypothetical protein